MTIVNKVEKSGIQVFNLEALWDQASVVELDISVFLAHGLVLREKEFRQQVGAYNWAEYADKHVAVYCATAAIVPTWAFVLIAARLDAARSVVYGRRHDLVQAFFTRALEAEDWSRYRDRIVVIKGCGSDIVPPGAYVTAMQKLMPVARKVMYGEPCSSVPLWRRGSHAN